MRVLDRFEQEKAAREFLSFQADGVLCRADDLRATARHVCRTSRARLAQAMRLFVSGSAPLPAHVHDAFRERFGHAILERYGMTETFMNVSNPYDGERRAGTVGFPLPGVEVRIVTEDGRAAAPDEAGEVQIKGANVFAGYWGREEASRAAFVDDWFRTGDIGVRSADGYISLRGRATDLIISGGFNIYPREIEEVILEAPGVREAVVVGAGDPVRGEVPVAYIAAGRCVSTRPRSSSISVSHWPRSRCRGRSCAWNSCRAPLWARCRSICCRRGRPEAGKLTRMTSW